MNDVHRVEAEAGAQDDWVDHVNEVAGFTLYPKAACWYIGANIPGKPRVFMPYVGWVGAYREKCDEIAAAATRASRSRELLIRGRRPSTRRAVDGALESADQGGDGVDEFRSGIDGEVGVEHDQMHGEGGRTPPSARRVSPCSAPTTPSVGSCPRRKVCTGRSFGVAGTSRRWRLRRIWPVTSGHSSACCTDWNQR